MAQTNDLALDFGESNEPTSIDLLKGHWVGKAIVLDEDSNEITRLIAFKTNTGKGSGPQKVRIPELPEFLSVLRKCAERGEGEAVEAGYVPAPILVGQTFQRIENDDDDLFSGRDYFQWNCATGKGSKPAKVPVDEMDEFLALLETNIDRTMDIAYERGWVEAPEADEADEDDEDEVDIGDLGDDE